jgi:LuxR family maltose regulon positive regulatory protein
LHAAADLALIDVMRGETGSAHRWSERHDQLRGAGEPSHPAVGARLAAGLLALDRLEGEPIRPDMDVVVDGALPVELWPFIAYLIGQRALHFGDRAATFARVAKMQGMHAPALRAKGAAAVLLARVRADLLLAMGQGQRARAVLPQGGRLPASLVVPNARAHLLGGEYRKAGAAVTRAVVDGPISARDKQELLLIGAAAALRTADRDGARSMFAQVMELYEQTRILRVFATLSRPDLVGLQHVAGVELDVDDQAALAARPTVYPEHVTLITLTKRELALVRELELSGSRKEIADALFVSLNTIKSQLLNLYHKLGTSSREETLMKVRELGLLS